MRNILNEQSRWFFSTEHDCIGYAYEYLVMPPCKVKMNLYLGSRVSGSGSTRSKIVGNKIELRYISTLSTICDDCITSFASVLGFYFYLTEMAH